MLNLEHESNVQETPNKYKMALHARRLHFNFKAREQEALTTNEKNTHHELQQ
jgi:hypothetical protein